MFKTVRVVLESVTPQKLGAVHPASRLRGRVGRPGTTRRRPRQSLEPARDQALTGVRPRPNRHPLTPKSPASITTRHAQRSAGNSERCSSQELLASPVSPTSRSRPIATSIRWTRSQRSPRRCLRKQQPGSSTRSSLEQMSICGSVRGETVASQRQRSVATRRRCLGNSRLSTGSGRSTIGCGLPVRVKSSGWRSGRGLSRGISLWSLAALGGRRDRTQGGSHSGKPEGGCKWIDVF